MPNYLLTHRYGWATTEEFGQHTLTVFSNSTDQAAVAQAAATAFTSTMTTALRAVWPAVIQYNRVSAARILSLATGELNAATHVAVNQAGTSSTVVPPQLSVVVSLNGGGRANGTPVRGRFYLPPVAVYNGLGNPETAGRIGAGTINPIANWVSAWFTALDSAGLNPVVWSRTLGSAGTANTVRIGNVADTVRRRRNQLVETYSPVTYPVPPVPEP